MSKGKKNWKPYVYKVIYKVKWSELKCGSYAGGITSFFKWPECCCKNKEGKKKSSPPFLKNPATSVTRWTQEQYFIPRGFQQGFHLGHAFCRECGRLESNQSKTQVILGNAMQRMIFKTKLLTPSLRFVLRLECAISAFPSRGNRRVRSGRVVQSNSEAARCYNAGHLSSHPTAFLMSTFFLKVKWQMLHQFICQIKERYFTYISKK